MSERERLSQLGFRTSKFAPDLPPGLTEPEIIETLELYEQVRGGGVTLEAVGRIVREHYLTAHAMRVTDEALVRIHAHVVEETHHGEEEGRRIRPHEQESLGGAQRRRDERGGDPQGRSLDVEGRNHHEHHVGDQPQESVPARDELGELK